MSRLRRSLLLFFISTKYLYHSSQEESHYTPRQKENVIGLRTKVYVGAPGAGPSSFPDMWNNHQACENYFTVK